MEIRGKAHLMFEQSGVFKNEFIKLGIPAEDYDIQNNFGQTDHQIDLFAEIEKAWMGGISIFQSISYNDLIIAFFPCIYFETIQMCYYQLTHNNNRHKTIVEKIDDAIERVENRTRFHVLLYKLVRVCLGNNLRLIIENPATTPSYLIGTQNFPSPTFIDQNRKTRGDYFSKPTAYWFFNCEPSNLYTFFPPREEKTILTSKSSPKAGICSEERSMISPGYARNFICDFILGKAQENTQLSIF